MMSPLAHAETLEPIDYELTLFTGYRTSDAFEYEVINGEESTEHSVDVLDDASFGVVIAWEYDFGRQGQILFSQSVSEFDKDILLDNYELSISYLHFGGSVDVSEGRVPVLLSVGLGATHLKPDEEGMNSETKFSGHIGLGARFEVISDLSISLDARLYATVIDSGGSLFCSDQGCDIETTGNLWLQGELSAGLVFKF